MHRKVLCLLVPLLAACSAGVSVRYHEAANDYLSLDGATLRLNRAIEVPAGRTRVFMQNGSVLVGYSVNEYAPQCNFEVRDLLQQSQAIQPDRFLIQRVQAVREPVVQARRVLLASLGDFDGEGASYLFEGYHFWLHSPHQPQVMRLTCHGAYASPEWVQPPTLVEIRETLGEVARFEALPD